MTAHMIKITSNLHHFFCLFGNIYRLIALCILITVVSVVVDYKDDWFVRWVQELQVHWNVFTTICITIYLLLMYIHFEFDNGGKCIVVNYN